MQRRKFLAASAAAIPTLFFCQGFNFNEEKTKKGFVVKATQSRFNETTKLNGRSPNDIKLSGKDTAGKLSLFEYTGNEKGGPPLHFHWKQDEIFFIVEGEYLFKVGDETHELKTGDSIFLPRKVPHTFAQTTEQGRMLFMFQPSGKMEAFFRALASLKEPPTPEDRAKIFSDHDMKVVGPPLSY